MNCVSACCNADIWSTSEFCDGTRLADGGGMGVVFYPHPSVFQGTQQGSCYTWLKTWFKIKAQFQVKLKVKELRDNRWHHSNHEHPISLRKLPSSSPSWTKQGRWCHLRWWWWLYHLWLQWWQSRWKFCRANEGVNITH